MSRNRTTLFAVSAALLAVACGAPAGSGAQDRSQALGLGGPKRAVIVIRGEPFSLSRDMASASSTGSVTGAAEVSMLLSSSLATIVDGTTVGGLVLGEAAPTTENGLWKLSPDGQMETTWKLRQGAIWHDGAPVTAEDFVFATQIGQTKEVAAVRNAAYASLSSIDTPDQYTMRLRWSQPFIEADSWFGGLEPQPKHLLAKALADDPSTFAHSPLFTTQFIGTGPFKLREWIPGSHLVMEAFNGYFLGRPRLNEIEVKFALDPNVIVANLLSGAADISFGRGVALEQALEVRERWRDGNVAFETRVPSWIVLYPQFLNPNPPLIANLQFRRALMHTLDRQEMADTLYRGLVQVPHSIIGPSSPIYSAVESAIFRHEYDPRRAAQTLEGLGLSKRTDGFYYDAAGARIELPLRTTAGDPAQGSLMFSTADQWKRAGLDTDPDVLALQASQDREYRANLPGFQVVTANTEFRLSNLRRYTSAEASLPENRYAGSNRGRYTSPEFDEIFAEYGVTIPQQQRTDLARTIVRHLSENLPDMPLAYNVRAVFISNRLLHVTEAELTTNGYLWDTK